MALEVSDLIKEYEISDTVNDDINTRLESAIPFECPCVDVQKCERTKNLLDYIGTMSKFHPERKGIITYIRSQICDPKNRRITCCGKQLGLVPQASPQPSNTSLSPAEMVSTYIIPKIETICKVMMSTLAIIFQKLLF